MGLFELPDWAKPLSASAHAVVIKQSLEPHASLVYLA
jgi:hypothetical protein